MSDAKKYYKKRNKDGSESSYTPARLLKQAYKYFDWSKKNPLKRREILKTGSQAGNVVMVDVERPYTLVGLCNYIGISEKTFRQYEADEAYAPIASHIKDVIVQDLLESALVDSYNPTIIARMLNLIDKQDRDICTELTINVNSEDTKHKLLKLQNDLQKRD